MDSSTAAQLNGSWPHYGRWCGSQNGRYGTLAPRPPGQSALMPVNFTTLPHFSVSSAISLPKSAGVPGSTVPPKSASRALILGSARPALISFELLDDLGWRVLGRAEAKPEARLIARHELAHGWKVRQRVRPRHGGHCERAQPTSPDIPYRSDSSGEHDLHLSTEQIIERRPATTIGYMGHVDAVHRLERLTRQMGGSADPGGRQANLARVGLGIGDELGNSFGRNRWMYRYDVGLPVNAGDRRDVADEIETKLVIERGVDGIPTADHEQRVAVCGRAHDGLGADIAAAARSVLDNELLTEPLRQPLTHQTRDDVGRTGRSERHDDAHRPRRIGLRDSDVREGRQRGSARGQIQKLTTGKFHIEPPSPFTLFDHLVGQCSNLSGIWRP